MGLYRGRVESGGYVEGGWSQGVMATQKHITRGDGDGDGEGMRW